MGSYCQVVMSFRPQFVVQDYRSCHGFCRIVGCVHILRYAYKHSITTYFQEYGISHMVCDYAFCSYINIKIMLTNIAQQLILGRTIKSRCCSYMVGHSHDFFYSFSQYDSPGISIPFMSRACSKRIQMHLQRTMQGDVERDATPVRNEAQEIP